jgi:hypothetical protein
MFMKESCLISNCIKVTKFDSFYLKDYKNLLRNTDEKNGAFNLKN